MRFRSKVWFFSMALLAVLSGCQKKPESSVHRDENATLMMAADHGDLSRVQQLLREGADVHERTSGGKTALHYAAQSKNVAVVKALIQAGAEVNSKMAGNVTPLMLSLDMAFGQPEIALALIRAGADVNLADANGDTALIIAATESSDEVLQALLENGANPNARGLNGETALHYVAMNAILGRAKLLLDHGADPTIRNSAGRTPYDDAETTNPEKSVQTQFQEMRNLLSEASQQKAKAATKSRLVLVLYRKRELARRGHEHGGSARFRYSDMKEAARFASDAGVMQIQLREEQVWWRPEERRMSTAPNGERERIDQVPWKDDVLRRVEDICRTRRHSNTECVAKHAEVS
jgi:hypothetical protein